MIRKSNEESIKEVINQLLDSYKLRDKLNKVKLLRSWEKIMGDAIAKRTDKIIFKEKVLTIYLTSAPLKEELTYGKEKIKKLLNEELGGEFIEEVEIR